MEGIAMNCRKPVFETISAWSAHRPDKIAVTFSGQNLSYRQLELQSNLLAGYLISTYPKNQRGRIAVYLEPGLMMPVVLLAILKAGCTYIPLSHFQPNERITKILDDASVFLLLTTRSTINKAGIEKLFPSTLALEDIHYPDLTVPISLPVVHETDLAYVLYTSGSTGAPKGVAIEHCNLSYYLNWFNQELWPETQAVLPLTSTLSFAAAVTQLYAPLLRGDTLHILPADSLHEPEVLLSWYQQHPRGAIYCVPTVWDELLRYHRDVDSPLNLPRIVFLSGEPVPFDLKERTFEQCPEVKVYNLYGPTEATANGSFARLEKQHAVTLGKALRGSKILIVDENLTPVEVGKSGEICIVGEGVARGYINQDSLTQQRFFTYESDNVCYRAHRTGDLGRFDSQGDIVYLGRIDRQIKINGVRIDPEEIETALREDARISHALVRAFGEEKGSARLIAYLVSPGTSISTNEIRSFLRTKLPVGMIPSHFITVETLPKLPNGKLDLQRLPAPCPTRPTLSYSYRQAANEMEQELIEIFQDILNFRELGADDNFFDLGGSSLQVIQARQMIRRRLFSDIDYFLFFNNATPHLLSFIVPYYVNDEDTVCLDQGLESAPLSGEQHYFLTLDQISPDPRAYQIAFCLTWHGPLNIAALEWCTQRILEDNPVLRSRFDLDNVSCREGAYSSAALQISQQRCCQEVIVAGELNDELLLASVGSPEMDLEQMPLICIRLLSSADAQHILLVQVHHTVFDHDSISLFFNQFIHYMRAYYAGDRGFRLGQGKRYQHYRQWQQQIIKPTRYPQERQFWLETFAEYVQAGADASLFHPQADQEGENRCCILSPVLTQKLRSFAKERQTTVFVCMLAAFNLLLNSDTRYRHVPIGIPVSSRMLYEETELLGCFVNRVTYYDKVFPNDDINTLLVRCRKKMYAILDNQTLPYDVLNNDIRAQGWSEKLYAPVCFNYLTAMPAAVPIDNIEFNVNYIESSLARVDLTLSVNDGDRLRVCFNYHKNVFNAEQINVLSKKYLSLLTTMIQPG
ncbi:amino acid adenylation domain-containing protein [Serratia quinivorans]|uniref:Amino acid adenylation domain-containing protein n=1 Tax=Serratia quinivorans TaxID=137545 RepID=A0ABV3UMU7_9GAMM|nr:amino acid adenylation domain-containing protein [Serratia quinivorans]